MRALPALRLASTAVTAALLFAITAPAAVAADHESKRERVESAAKAPLPGADALLAQVHDLQPRVPARPGHRSAQHRAQGR